MSICSTDLNITMLQCYEVRMLTCYNVSMLRCHNVTMLQCYNVTMLQCYSVTMLQCYNVTMLQCYNVTMLQCYNVTMFITTISKSTCAFSTNFENTRSAAFEMSNKISFWINTFASFVLKDSSYMLMTNLNIIAKLFSFLI